MKHHCLHVLPFLLLFLFLALWTLYPPQAVAAPKRDAAAPERQSSLSKEQAARVARDRTGGRVLSVRPTAGGFRVKVLTPDGEVRYVPVGAGGR